MREEIYEELKDRAHELECARAAIALLIEMAKAEGNRREVKELRRFLKEFEIERAQAGQWRAIAYENGERHVVPISDLRPHVHPTSACWCAPFDEDGVTVHNSLDGREQYERGEKISS